MLAEISKLFLEVVLCFMYELSLVGHNSKQVYVLYGFEVLQFIKDIDQVLST